jgi:hypothetical protein
MAESAIIKVVPRLYALCVFGCKGLFVFPNNELTKGVDYERVGKNL